MDLSQCDRDLAAIIAGRLPSSSSMRSVDDSRTLVDQLLTNWQLLPSISERAICEFFPGVLQTDDHQRLKHAYLAITAFAKVQIAACLPLLGALQDSGIPYSLLKGGATSFLVYPEPHMRAAWDFDIAVSRQHLVEAEALAHAVGYQPAQQDPKTKRFHRANPQLRAAVEANHHELGFLMRRLQVTNLPTETVDAIRAEPWTRIYWLDSELGNPWCYAGIDIHHALSLDIGVDDLLARRRLVTAKNGAVITIPDDAWLTAHLIFKLYWEGVHNYAKGLYQFADLIRLAPRLDPNTFADVEKILARYNLLAAGYYVLRRLPMFGLELPQHILQFIDEGSSPDRNSDPIQNNDLGDMWPKLWGYR